jgi:hypothetical protein
MKATVYSEVLKLRDEIGESRWNSEILRTQPGSTTMHSAITSGGVHITSSASVDNDRNIQVTVGVSNTGLILVNSKLKWNGINWEAASREGTTTQQISPSTPLDSIVVSALVVGVASYLIGSKANAVPTNQNNPSNEDNPCDLFTTNPNPEFSDCIIHDLVCTPLGGGDWPFTTDHRHIQFWAPGIGSYKVDIGNCCFNHDIACWCAHIGQDVDEANRVVLNCILGDVIAGAWTTLAHEDWWWGKKAVVGALLGIWTIATAGADLVIGGIFDLGYDGALKAWLDNNPCYANFDHSHDDSCLCGGSKPTVQCQNDQSSQWGGYDGCTDICKVAGGDSAAREVCFPCHWQCAYDSNGKLLPRQLITSSTGEPCCPGTDGSGFRLNAQNTFDLVACNPESSQPPCPACQGCSWFCQQNHNGYFDYYRVVDESPGAPPCCPNSQPTPTPTDWPSLRCDSNPHFNLNVPNSHFMFEAAWGRT